MICGRSRSVGAAGVNDDRETYRQNKPIHHRPNTSICIKKMYLKVAFFAREVRSFLRVKLPSFQIVIMSELGQKPLFSAIKLLVRSPPDSGPKG